MNEFDILVIGSLNCDLVVTTDRFPDPGETRSGSDFQTHCGGKGANQAYAAAALGGNVAMIGRVGTDVFGDAQSSNLSSMGVDTTLLQSDPSHPTGTALITVNGSGENQIIVVPGANGELTPNRLQSKEIQAIQSAKIVLLQLEIPIETVSQVIHEADGSNAQVILDPAPARPIPSEWYPSIDFLTPNLSELGALTGTQLKETASLADIVTSAQILSEQGCRSVIAKLGSRGALLVTQDESAYFAARTVPVVDTTAAGDCFNAAFAVALARGCTAETAIPFAIEAASLSVTRQGAQSSMPLRDELEAFAKL